MTISMEKWRKCTSQIFCLSNFIAQIFAKQAERFSKNMNLWKMWKFDIQNIIWRSAYKNEENVWLLKLHYTDLCKTSWEIFKNHELIKNMKIAHFIGYIFAIYGWIWPKKIVLWQSLLKIPLALMGVLTWVFWWWEGWGEDCMVIILWNTKTQTSMLHESSQKV